MICCFTWQVTVSPHGKDNSEKTWMRCVFVQSKWLLRDELIHENKQDEAQDRDSVWWWYTVSQPVHLSLFNAGINAYLKSLKVMRGRSYILNGMLALWLGCPGTGGSQISPLQQSFCPSCWKALGRQSPTQLTCCKLRLSVKSSKYKYDARQGYIYIYILYIQIQKMIPNPC